MRTSGGFKLERYIISSFKPGRFFRGAINQQLPQEEGENTLLSVLNKLDASIPLLFFKLKSNKNDSVFLIWYRTFYDRRLICDLKRRTCHNLKINYDSWLYRGTIILILMILDKKKIMNSKIRMYFEINLIFYYAYKYTEQNFR